jgi:hypothetical protein
MEQRFAFCSAQNRDFHFMWHISIATLRNLVKGSPSFFLSIFRFLIVKVAALSVVIVGISHTQLATGFLAVCFCYVLSIDIL